MSKPTDSEQLRSDINKIVVDICGKPDGNPSSVATCRELVIGLMMYIQERDQQRLSAWTTERATYRRTWIPKADVLSAVLEAAPEYIDPGVYTIQPIVGPNKSMVTGFNNACAQWRQALTAALGPDNSKTKGANMDSVQQGPPPEPPEQIGWCQFSNCGKDAYYNIDLKVDDMDADLCERHFSKLMKMLGVPLSEDDKV